MKIKEKGWVILRTPEAKANYVSRIFAAMLKHPDIAISVDIQPTIKKRSKISDPVDNGWTAHESENPVAIRHVKSEARLMFDIVNEAGDVLHRVCDSATKCYVWCARHGCRPIGWRSWKRFQIQGYRQGERFKRPYTGQTT